MKHYLYCSSGNTEGIDEYVAFFEIADHGYCSRYLEVKSDGDALRYTEKNPADQFGVLPEGQFDEAEFSKPEYGRLNEISKRLFDSVWDRVESRN